MRKQNNPEARRRLNRIAEELDKRFFGKSRASLAQEIRDIVASKMFKASPVKRTDPLVEDQK